MFAFSKHEYSLTKHTRHMTEREIELQRIRYERYCLKHPDKIAEKRERERIRMTEKRKTPLGRAAHLLDMYKISDKRMGRGEGDLTPEWIVDYIFSKPCAHCGKTRWKVIGCNRLNNALPHTKENVEPCCEDCNKKLHGEDLKGKGKRLYQYTLDGELVKIWNCLSDVANEGFNISNVSACCHGRLKQYKGYRWSYEPL